MKKIFLLMLVVILVGCTNSASIKDIAPNYDNFGTFNNGERYYMYELTPGDVKIETAPRDYKSYFLKKWHRNMGNEVSEGVYKDYKYVRGINDKGLVYLDTILDGFIISGQVNSKNEEKFIPIFYDFVKKIDNKIKLKKNASN